MRYLGLGLVLALLAASAQARQIQPGLILIAPHASARYRSPVFGA